MSVPPFAQKQPGTRKHHKVRRQDRRRYRLLQERRRGHREATGFGGAAVVVNYASSKAGAYLTVDQSVSTGGRAIAIGGSVASEDDMIRLFAEVKTSYGRVDVLVNNAGVYAFGPIESLSIPEFKRH